MKINKIFRKIIVRLTPLLWPVDICSIVRNNRKVTGQLAPDAVQPGSIVSVQSVSNAPAQPGSIVFVRLDAIGDFVLWLDAARGFRTAWKDRRIVLVCNKACASIAGNTGLFDDVFPVDVGSLNFAGNFKFRRELRRQLEMHFSGGSGGEAVDLVVQTAYNRRVYTDLVVSSIPAVRKVSVLDDSYDNAARWALMATDRIYDELVDTSDEPVMELVRNANPSQGTRRENAGGEPVMELVRNARLVRWLANKDFRAGVPVLPKSLKPVETTLQPEAVISRQPYFVIFPGGSFTRKMWPMDRFAKVADYIFEKTGWTCVVCGAPNEKHLAELLRQGYSGEFLDLTGRTTLLESIEVIRYAKLLVGNDTSGIHFAAATGTPSVCAFGGWHYGRFLPYAVEGQDEAEIPSLPHIAVSTMDCFNCKIIHNTPQCRRHCKQTGLFACVDAVTVDKVIEKVEECICIFDT